MFTLVNKTIYQNPGNVFTHTVTLSNPASTGNLLFVVETRPSGGSSTVTVSNSQALLGFEPLTYNYGGGTSPPWPAAAPALHSYAILVSSTITSVSFSPSTGSNPASIAVYEFSCTNSADTFANNFLSTSALTPNTTVSTINSGGVAEGNSAANSNLYFGLMFTGSTGELSGFPVGFNVDLFSHGSSGPTDPNSLAVGYLIGTGTQSYSASVSPSDYAAVLLGGLFDDSSPALTVTTTALQTSVDPSNPGESVIFTAIVDGPGGSGSPTGTVAFSVDGIVVDTVSVSAVATGISQAQYSTSSLSLGIHAVIATYSGDSAYDPSTSPTIYQIVQQPCPFPFSTALQELANRLYDPTMQFWSQAELIFYVQEAFRTWNSLTSYWRNDFTFPTVANAVFYDITNQTTAPDTLRPHTITDRYLYDIIEYHLLEPVVGAGPWTGSAQFTIDDIMGAMQRRQNEILSVTGCAITEFLLPAAPDRIYLPNTTLEVRRVAFMPEVAGLTTSPMFEDDTWGVQSYDPEYTTQPPGVPSTYRLSTEPLLSFDADVPPLPGSYDVLTIESGPTLTVATASTFTIPDDWTWVLKWGALADLLSRESNAKDLLRAKYCNGRYQQGLKLMAAASALLAARSNNLPLQVDSVKSADLYQSSWQAATPGEPIELLTAGLNLVAVNPPPDGAYSLTATVVENAPVPVNLTDCLNLTQDVFDVIIDYAQHLAAFKMSGTEFMETEPLLQRFMQMAALYSSKLAEQGEFTKMLYAVSQLEPNMNPRYSADNDPASGGSQ